MGSRITTIYFQWSRWGLVDWWIGEVAASLPIHESTTSGGFVPRVYIVTDSAATIEPAVAKRLEIIVIPLTVRVGDKEIQDNGDLSHEELLLCMASQPLLEVTTPI